MRSRASTASAIAAPESDTRVTNQDQSGGSHRLAPRPVSRPPVDPAERHAFGRPEGVNGSFVGCRPLPRPGRVHTDGSGARPGAGRGVRPAVCRRGLAAAPPRRRRRAGRRTPAGRRGARRPVARSRRPAALGTPALPQPAPAPTAVGMGKLGVRDVLFGGKVSYVALAILAVIALVIGFAGGWVGRKTAEVVEAFTTSKVTLETSGNAEATHRPVRQGRRVGGRFGRDGRGDQRRRGLAGLRSSSSTAAATSSPTTT